MKIEVRRLNAQKKYEGEFSYDYDPEEDLCLLPFSKLSDIKVSGRYEIYEDDEVSVTLTVKYKIVGKCSYCLSPAEQPVEFGSEVLFVPRADDDNYRYDGISIDLAPAVKDAILISQPSVLLCREDCTGIDVEKKEV